MTVYVTGDIHSGLDMQKLRDWELGDGLTSEDNLLVAGDFGFPWDFSAEECADIAWLESRPYTVLFVDGNHEYPANPQVQPEPLIATQFGTDFVTDDLSAATFGGLNAEAVRIMDQAGYR